MPCTPPHNTPTGTSTHRHTPLQLHHWPLGTCRFPPHCPPSPAAESEVSEAFLRASNEAKSAFGDGRMFMEKYVEEPRHIEIQASMDLNCWRGFEKRFRGRGGGRA